MIENRHIQAVECDTIVAIDFETTGTAPGFLNMPWQIGIAVLQRGKMVPERSFTSWLRVPAEHPFNPYTPGRWGQIRQQLTEAPTLPELWQELQPVLTAGPLVAHHAPTERSILRQCLPLQQFPLWIDTLALARMAFPKRRSYKLEELVPELGLLPRVKERCPDGAAHDALYDAIACATFLESLLQCPGWSNATIANLAAVK